MSLIYWKWMKYFCQLFIYKIFSVYLFLSHTTSHFTKTHFFSIQILAPPQQLHMEICSELTCKQLRWNWTMPNPYDCTGRNLVHVFVNFEYCHLTDQKWSNSSVTTFQANSFSSFLVQFTYHIISLTLLWSLKYIFIHQNKNIDI